MFPHNSIKTKSLFELIHLDICGPYKIKSYNGCNQFPRVIHDYSRFTWVHLLKHITDCVKVMMDFFSYVETQFKAKVLQECLDNALELCQRLMKALFLAKGIVQQTSCSHTP